MMRQTQVFVIVLILVILLYPVFGLSGLSDRQDDTKNPKLIIFFSPICSRCVEVKSEIMPKIEREYRNRISIEYLDINYTDNYKMLVALEEQNFVELGNSLPVFYFAGRFLEGTGNYMNLENAIRRLLNESLSTVSQNQSLPDIKKIDLVERFKGFKPFAVISAGLIDGINPCAFTVIVFFISFLALQGYRKRELVLIGLTFILAVFLTYLLIGLGLFSFLYQLQAFHYLSKIFNSIVGSLSMVLGILCLYDFWKFKQTGNAEGMILQLPQAVKNRIHKVIGSQYRVNKSQDTSVKKNVYGLALSAFVTGILVSVLEAVCTGQVYLPTIVFVLKTTPLKLQAVSYFLLYNLMFVVPLLLVFIFALSGITSEQFAGIFKRHILSVKLLMALLFFALGLFLIWRG